MFTHQMPDPSGQPGGGSASGGALGGGQSFGGRPSDGSGSGGESSGGSPGSGGSTGGESTGGVPGSGGSGGEELTGGSAGSGSGGLGGDIATGGTGGGSVGSGGAPTGPEPTIPSPSGACPDFTSGTQTILGLETDILAGNPGATKGPLLFTWHGTSSSGTVALNFQLPSSVRDDITAQGGLVIAPNDDGTVREGTSPNGVWYETSDLEYADHIVACAV
jgi:hypothetical protein